MSKDDEKEEFISFLEAKFHEYVHDTGRMRKHRHFGDFGYQFEQALDVQNRVSTVLKAPQTHVDGDYSRIFTHQFLEDTVVRIDSHYSNTKSYMQDYGYLDLVNDHFDIIAENVTVDMLPSEDLEILRMLGSENPERMARAAIFSLRSISKNRRQSDMHSVKFALDEGKERIQRMRKQYEESHPTNGMKKTMEKEGRLQPDPPKPPRKWWKGCGQIAQGCALTMGNIGLAFDLLGLPVSAETKTWGSVVSVTTGVGLIMSGVGDLRGE